jgi:hypothetical protein
MDADTDGVVSGTGAYEHSASIGKVALALAKAQGAMKSASKDATVTTPQYTRRYADLASCWEVARAPLAANELAFVQMTEPDQGGLSLISMLVHSSGEFLRSRLFMPLVQATPQAVGSAITYGRRYGMCALLGIAAEEDDDGNEAQKHAPGPQRPPVAKAPPTRTASQAARDMEALLQNAKSPPELDAVWTSIEGMPFPATFKTELRKSYEREMNARWPEHTAGASPR